MKRIRHLSLIAIIMSVATVFIVGGCEKSADPLQLNNPFDPASPTGGDGLQVRAVVSGNSVILTWNQPQGMDVSHYNLFQSDEADGTYEGFARVDHTASTIGNYTYKFPTPATADWFKVRASTVGGEFSLFSLAVPAQAMVGPVVIVGDTLTNLASPFQELTITAAFGDSLLIGLDEVLNNPLRVASSGPGMPTVINFDFGPAAADSTFHLRVLAFDAISATPTTKLDFPVRFAPKHTLVGANRLKLATRVNDLAIPSAGAIQMRFADSEANLALAPWIPGADLYPAYPLSDSANPQEIWAEFEGEFGFNSTSFISVRPDLLTSAAFNLKVPSNRVVSTLTVPVEFTAAATDLRISENPNFAAVPWQAFADSMTFQLSAGEGTKTIYTQYRNDWTQSNILSDYCILISQGPDVNFVVPSDGTVLTAGSTVTVRGTSSQGTVATGVDTVQVDFGEGLGFREVLGVENWQLNWNVPTFTADTEVVLRARAVAGDLVVTDFISVTVTQMTVAILDPLENGTVISGEPVNIAGTAGGMLGGDPIDTVVIDIGSEQITATSTNIWAETWTATDVLVDTPTTITVTAWAGTESVSASVNIVIQPAP